MLISCLKDRGISISDSPSISDLNTLKNIIPHPIFSMLNNNIYQYFDGFECDDFDSASFLRIWPIRRILSSKYLSKDFVPFMDFSLDSETYGLTSNSLPFILRFHQKSLSPVTIDKLLDCMCNGDFDDSLGV